MERLCRSDGCQLLALPNNSLERTGDSAAEAEKIEMRALELRCDGAVPGRSARSR